MVRQTRRLVAALIMALSVSVITWSIANAYVYYGYWPSSTQSYTLSGFPAGWSSHLIASADTWTAVTPAKFTYQNAASGGRSVSYGPYDGPMGTLGYTSFWAPLGVMLSASTVIDSAENWYVGTGAPSSTQFDLRSTATHEFGHMLGLDHTSGIYCPNNTNNATMCHGILLGQYYKRTLEGDDRNGINFLYP